MTPTDYQARIDAALLKRSRPAPRHSVALEELVLSDIPIEVEAHYERGHPGSWDQPPEPAGWQIKAVFLDGSSVDLTDHLSEDQMQAIHEALNADD